MDNTENWATRFKRLFLNNRFVLFLLVLLLIGLNIMVLSKVSFIFHPLHVLLKTVVLPIILTGIVYYLLNPIVNFLERHKVKRIYSILMLYVIIIGIVAVLLTLVIPVIQEQIMDLVSNFPAYIEMLREQFEHLMGSKIVNQFQDSINFDPQEIFKTVSQRVTSFLNKTWIGIGGFVGSLIEVVLSVVTVPFILFYLLKDGKKLPGFILSFVPTKLRGETDRVMKEMNHQISSYIRGQIIISFCIGALLFIGYIIIGLKYSLILAVVAAFTSVVPYLGPAIAITPALIVALVTSPVMLLKMVIVWTVVQLIEGKFISPQVMGKTLKIHPIMIIFVILTSGNLFGVVGILLAVPGYAVLKVIASHIYQWFRVRSRLYESDPVKPEV
ncbi:AI-2E family transporter [Paenibacillus sp.]|jgi:predicted PurR-regulated permease PerM|uniref:AI-2E family transporter n=1 Tax=Paenibacillus sp. TaxID=58172 RepID=UPI00283A5182|nr:AI-2E family transporter [Paenibacillus sp.]MDR0268528.1 AI-2E family transporter [Paenibacillus sp.]